MKRIISILSLLLLISTYFTIGIYGSAIDSEIWLDKATYAGYGARPIMILKDNDLNLNPKRKDVISVNVCSTTDTSGITVNLTETTTGSGEFTSDFGLTETKSDDIKKMLQVRNKDTITITYKETTPGNAGTKTFECSAKWQATTGTVKLAKNSYVGLSSVATVYVTDKDMDLRSGYIDTARVRIYTEADPKGIILTAYENGANTGTFLATFGFDTYDSDTGDAIVKVNPSDTIFAAYVDEMDEDGSSNVSVTANSSFKFAEASIKTSASKGEGSGNMLTITIDEPDANNPKIKDRLLAKASSGNGAHEKTIWLDESGTNTGSFKCRLLLSDEMTTSAWLRVNSSDTICIKYTDVTVPEGGTEEITTEVKWTYMGTIFKTDREVYSGYNTSARISLIDFNLNNDDEKAETIDVRATTSDSKGIKLRLKETSSNSGEFIGTLYFGKNAKASAGIIRVTTNEIITITYTNPKDKDDFVEYSFKWSHLDGQITLDKQQYTGDNTPVKITVRDLDASDNVRTKDELKVIVRPVGGKDINISLEETGKDSNTYTGTFYINGSGSNKPSLSLQPNEKFEVVYIDEYNTAGKEVNRIASSAWGGISKAVITLDKQKYTAADKLLVVTLIDPDQNKNSSDREKVTVSIRTKSGKTSRTYELTETGNDNGEFLAVIDFTESPSSGNTICLAAEDEISVYFTQKSASTYAKFTK